MEKYDKTKIPCSNKGLREYKLELLERLSNKCFEFQKEPLMAEMMENLYVPVIQKITKLMELQNERQVMYIDFMKADILSEIARIRAKFDGKDKNLNSALISIEKGLLKNFYALWMDCMLKFGQRLEEEKQQYISDEYFAVLTNAHEELIIICEFLEFLEIQNNFKAQLLEVVQNQGN